MIVLYNNQRWELDMSYDLFEVLKRTDPYKEVSIQSLTPSMYREKRKVKIIYLEDWSVARNLFALYGK